MIAFDSCVIIDFMQQKDTEQCKFLEYLIESKGKPVLPPVVVTELFSNPKQPLAFFQDVIDESDEFEIMPGYWQRAGALRAKLRAKKLKANTADALIAQFCIDHDIPLCTSDEDFRHYAKHGRLKLA